MRQLYLFLNILDSYLQIYEKGYILAETKNKYIMRLELKHLAVYLPYGLNMIYDFENGNVWELDTTNINAITEYDKPILRPLSDLTKEIEVNGEVFIPSIVFDLYNVETLFDCEKIHFAKIQKLFEYHFDVFGLIEKGLAIDINTL